MPFAMQDAFFRILSRQLTGKSGAIGPGPASPS